MLSPHNIQFNCNKLVGILFPPKAFNIFRKPKVVLGSVITFVKNVTYLRIKILADLSDDDDISR